MIIIRRQNYVFFLSYQEYINDKKQDTRINLSQKRIALLTNNVTSTIHSHQTSIRNKESRIATRKQVAFSGSQTLNRFDYNAGLAVSQPETGTQKPMKRG